MNKPKHQTTNRARKKMNKEIRRSVILPEPELTSDVIKAENLLSRYPKKIQKKETSMLKSLDKNFHIKLKKLKSPHSKRTAPGTPGTQQREAAPKSAHIEGRRWLKAGKTKMVTAKKIQTRQNLKRKGR